MSQPGTKYLIKVNKIIDAFVDALNKNDINKSFNYLYKLRILHGKLICKIFSLSKSAKSSKKYFYISSFNSISNLINEKIIESEMNFNNYVASNNIDVSKLKLENNKLSKSSSISSNSDLSKLSVSSNLPLFEGEKSAETRKLDTINIEMNKNSKIIEFNESIPSLLLFFNPGCPACIKTKPHWDSLVKNLRNTFELKQHNLFNIMELDLSDSSNENLASLFQIEYIPTIIMMESSKKPSAKIEKVEGAIDREKLNEFIKSAYSKFSI